MSLIPSKDQLLMGYAVTAVPYPVIPRPDSGDMFTLREWAECVAVGGFIDDDGMGEWSDGTYISDGPQPEQLFHQLCDEMEASHLPFAAPTWIYPSQLRKGTLVKPAWATHVYWYNR